VPGLFRVSRSSGFLLDHACKCFHLQENVCGKWKFEAILGKYIFGNGVRLLGKLKKVLKKKLKPTYPT
jgi:hypothetical protein